MWLTLSEVCSVNELSWAEAGRRSELSWAEAGRRVVDC